MSAAGSLVLAVNSKNKKVVLVNFMFQLHNISHFVGVPVNLTSPDMVAEVMTRTL